MSLNARGDIHLLWFGDLTGTGQILTNFFSRSVDGGQTFSAPVNVATTTLGGRAVASLAVQPNGAIFVLWFDQTTSNLVVANSTDGTHFSSPTVVWTAAGNPNDLKTAVGSQGQIYAAWTKKTSDQDCSILFSSSMDGTTFSAAATISAGTGACNIRPEIFVDSQDNVNVSWTADGTSLFFSRSRDSGATFSSPASVPTSGQPRNQQIAVGPDGTIYIAWDASPAALFSRSTDGGATFSAATMLTVGTPLVNVDACNDISVVGESTPGPGIGLQRSTDSGVTFTSPITLSRTFANFDAKLAIDPRGNLNVVYDVDGPPQVAYVRVPSTCGN